MANTSELQMALAHDAQFLNRVQYSLCRVALQVCQEAGTVPSHAVRRTYAQQVLGNPGAASAAAAVALVGSVNLLSGVTTTMNPNGSASTDATDAAIDSQVSSLWNAFAGV